MTSRRTSRLAAALSIVAVILIAVPGSAIGHAELATVTPADTSTVGRPPSEIVMTFTQPLDPGRSSIRLVDASGTLVVEGGSIDIDDAKTLRLVVPADLTPGAYTIRWTSFSTEDNEQDRGTTTFTVAAASLPPTVPPSGPPSVAPSTSPSVASVAPTVTAPSASAPPTSPTASTSDALIPIVMAVLAILGLGAWIAARSRRAA